MVNHWSRQVSLDYAFWLTKDSNFDRIVAAPPTTASDHTVALVYRLWAQLGAQSITMPHTFAAALMATDITKVNNDSIRMPWPVFEVQVPDGLLFSSEGPVHSLYVARKPKFLKYMNDPNNEHQHMLCYADQSGLAVMTVGKFTDPMTEEELRTDITAENHLGIGNLSESLVENYDFSIETRLWIMARRLVVGAMLTIDNMKKDYEESGRKGKDPFPERLPAMKREKLKTNTYKIGKPLNLDCRPAIREYMQGTRRSEPSVTTIVRGHWRNQAYGPKHSLRREKWIMPFVRGEGPVIVRPTHISENTVKANE
jgi:hypothetical protein